MQCLARRWVNCFFLAGGLALVFLIAYLLLLGKSDSHNLISLRGADQKVQVCSEGFTCYQFQNRSAKMAFSNETIEFLHGFKIFHETGMVGNKSDPIHNLRNTNPSEELIIVTASSSDHYLESLEMVYTAQAAFAKIKLRIIFYDLGLKDSQIQTVRSLCSVEYRKFRFEDYPKNVAVLKEYRWKPIIWAEVFSYGSEVYSFMWADSSVRWKLTQVRSFLKVMLPQLLAKIDQQKMTPIVLFGLTGHSNFAVTEPVMMDFLPTDIQQQKILMQREANIALVTRDHPNFILKWHVLCALEPECMGPMTADNNCLGFLYDKWTIQQCHRFDQAAINILLANAAGFNETFYTANASFYAIARGGGFLSYVIGYTPKKCIIKSSFVPFIS